MFPTSCVLAHVFPTSCVLAHVFPTSCVLAHVFPTSCVLALLFPTSCVLDRVVSLQTNLLVQYCEHLVGTVRTRGINRLVNLIINLNNYCLSNRCTLSTQGLATSMTSRQATLLKTSYSTQRSRPKRQAILWYKPHRVCIHRGLDQNGRLLCYKLHTVHRGLGQNGRLYYVINLIQYVYTEV